MVRMSTSALSIAILLPEGFSMICAQRRHVAVGHSAPPVQTYGGAARMDRREGEERADDSTPPVPGPRGGGEGPQGRCERGSEATDEERRVRVC